MFSSALELTLAELKAATATWKADKDARKTAGQSPFVCPPERSRIGLEDSRPASTPSRPPSSG